MAGFTCPRCGANNKSGNTCEYCGYVNAGESADKAKEQQTDGGNVISKIKSRNTGIILLAIVAIIIAVTIWYKVDPHSVPIWLQQIIVEIRKAFGATSWTIYGPWTKVQ